MGRKQNNNIQFMFSAILFVIVIQKVVEQRGVSALGCGGKAFVPEVAAMKDRKAH